MWAKFQVIVEVMPVTILRGQSSKLQIVVKVCGVCVCIHSHIYIENKFFNKHHTMKAYWGSGGTAPCIL
jgi:hypothetical protein